ncbi:MAG: sulfite exporter TauE/SafE family protein [Alicyclobacillaceae bacterium]|nr:sulfite exporter TauE/SafE family protein [Alicyclobacillaceae bacterium]
MGPEVSLGGFVVGLLVGLTGMGGGFIMTPMMIFLFGVAPSVAIGTDLVYSSVTKLVGAWQHWRQKTVDFLVVKWLAAGSVPGAVLGAFGVKKIHEWAGVGVDDVLRHVLGVTYLVVSLVMLLRIRRSHRRETEEAAPRPAPWKLVVLGGIGGFVVGLTSVGSGSLFIALLTMVYPVAAAKLVGTDITQAVLVTGAAGLTHLAFGTVNLKLVGWLLVGSIPGIILGSRLTTRVPDLAVRIGLVVMLAVSGVKLL